MKSIYPIITASSLALFLASCDRPAEAAKVPTQAEEIAEFCNQVAADFTANPSAPTGMFMGRVQQKILEKEWDPNTVATACSEALRRKRDFIQQHTQPLQKGSQ